MLLRTLVEGLCKGLPGLEPVPGNKGGATRLLVRTLGFELRPLASRGGHAQVTYDCRILPLAQSMSHF